LEKTCVSDQLFQFNLSTGETGADMGPEPKDGIVKAIYLAAMA